MERKVKLLDHVEDTFILVEPNVVVWNRDVLEGDLFSVFEERIGPPHGIEPRGGQQPVVGRQVVREAQSIILPRLWEEDVGRKRLLCVCVWDARTIYETWHEQKNRSVQFS